MKRVYTDPRFPNVEVVNDGDTAFHVVVDGEPQDQFVASEDIASTEVSDGFAQRQAKEYFDYRASQTSGDDDWRQDFGGGGTALAEPKPGKRKLGVRHEPGEQPADDADVFNNQPGEGSVGLDSMFPDDEMVTQADVDRMIAAARAEQDPARRAQMRQQALSAMRQLESLAHHLVRVMLS